MATLTIDRRSGIGYTIQWYEGKQRRSIFLGGSKFSQQTAQRLKEAIETLIWHRDNDQLIPEKSVTSWLHSAPTEIRSKLAKAGLIIIREQKTCQCLWNSFLTHKRGMKHTTVSIYLNSQQRFFEGFSPSEPIEKITADRLLAWKASQLSRYAPASVATYLKTVRAVFNWAVEQEWLSKSPMQHIPLGSFINRDKDRTITLDDYIKLLDACPSQEWRTIIALARIGGLRCPSELKRLTWRDIDWTQNRFVVQSPKTERQEKHKERIVPLFPELRDELDRHLVHRSTSDSDFIIQSFQGTAWYLHDTIKKIAHLAGLGSLDRPFDNLRMSRSNEVLDRWGPIKESLWIGHSEAVMKKHYLVLQDDAFTEASDRGTADRGTEIPC